MPRGMDERFEDPSEEPEEEEAAADEADEAAERDDHEAPGAPPEQSEQQEATGTTEAATGETADADEDPLNIREDWDSATIYVEPEQSEDIEVTFTRLKKQLKRDGVTLEKNKHFYRAIFEVAFGEYREETKEKIRELATEDTDQ
ncbi:hypothetical protein PM076_14760 [Halorubrum ezzemoulense]|uniref:hypothetical protein n=1 Tax=Halorubrum ezzemoulense TaxID=337243 RepID=UPI00232FA519|nr:hypothetical protein [Halorubrum ezzemoulense]MDB2245220.1 hypothetical protein [Halorubrum ezzemoulense]MDB2290076.1 hypothetical protein [Halorubrum ezzemoulense]MDB2297546.1 hypothetical protein [Halorubrum ezzemoulense]MDB2301126.1 hypothetical protein [Halorubrum ezzemoulense]